MMLHYDCSTLWQDAAAAAADDDDSFSVEIHLEATERHLPYGITQHYLPRATRHRWTRPASTPAKQAGTRFT